MFKTKLTWYAAWGEACLIKAISRYLKRLIIFIMKNASFRDFHGENRLSYKTVGLES